MKETFDVKAKYLNMKAARVSLAQYLDGTLAVALVDDEGLEKISVNLIAYYIDGVPKPEADQFYVKNYSEHEGLPFALRDAGIAETHCRSQLLELPLVLELPSRKSG